MEVKTLILIFINIVKRMLETDIKAQMTTKKDTQMEEEKAQENVRDSSAMEIENDDNIFPISSSSFSSFTLQDKRPKSRHFVPKRAGSSSNRLSVFGMEEEMDQKYQQKSNWRPDPSLFQVERNLNIYNVQFVPDSRIIEGDLLIPLGQKYFNTSVATETKCKFVFFTNERSEALKQTIAPLVQRGIDYEITPTETSDRFLNRLVLVTFKLRQPKSSNEATRQSTIKISMKNPMSIESFDKMESLSEEKIKTVIKLKDYNEILPLTNVKELIQTNLFIDKILDKIKLQQWKFNKKLSCYYVYEPRDDEKYISWNINLLMQIEDFSKFKLIINNKSVV